MNNINEFLLPVERQKELEQIVEELSTVHNLSTAFLSMPFKDRDEGPRFLSVVVDERSASHKDLIGPKITDLAKEFPYFKIQIFNGDQFKAALESGSLYILEHCVLGRWLYALEPSTDLHSWPADDYTLWPKIAKEYRKREIKKIRALANKAESCMESGKLGQAHFYLQQAFELTFQFLERMCLGKALTAQCIHEHLDHCASFLPEFQPFPIQEGEDHNELLRQLDGSCQHYVRELSIVPSKKQLQAIKKKLFECIEEVDAIFTLRLGRFTQMLKVRSASDAQGATKSAGSDHAPGQEISPESPSGSLLRDALAKIKAQLGPTHIYDLGRRAVVIDDKNHMMQWSGEPYAPFQYWLMVVVEEVDLEAATKIINEIERAHEASNLCLCVETEKLFSKKLKDRNEFFMDVATHCELLYKGAGSKGHLVEGGPAALDVPKTRRTITSRYNRAKNFLVAAKATSDNQGLSIQLMVLAVKQVCLGLIYGIWRYRPKDNSLLHLLKLSGYIYPDIHFHFPTFSRVEREMLWIMTESDAGIQPLADGFVLKEGVMGALEFRITQFMENSRVFAFTETDPPKIEKKDTGPRPNP